MKTKAIPILLILALALAGAAAAQTATEKWIHVRVQQNADSPDAETVTVNLPLSLITAAAALIPAEHVTDEAEIALDDLNMNWGDLRTFWDAVKDAPEATTWPSRTIASSERSKVAASDFPRLASIRGVGSLTVVPLFGRT